jgi:hypothetical protein
MVPPSKLLPDEHNASRFRESTPAGPADARVVSIREDAEPARDRTRVLTAAWKDGPVLVHAISGLGKSTLAGLHPGHVCDADEFLYAAVAMAFPTLEPRARLRAWRDLCQRQPWVSGSEELALWASVRRGIYGPILDVMRSGSARLVVTSLLDPPWMVSAFYGVKRGGYLAHLRRVGREVDNQQSEAMNDRLDGYAPLVRVAPGSFLADREEIRLLVGVPAAERARLP